jgi:hypothetical protein
MFIQPSVIPICLAKSWVEWPSAMVFNPGWIAVQNSQAAWPEEE